MVSFARLNHVCRSTEIALNIGGCFPGLNLATGPARVVLGQGQIIGGVAMAALYGTASLFNEKRHIKLEGKALKCMEYVRHGRVNTELGLFETAFTHLPILPFDAAGCKVEYHSPKEYRGRGFDLLDAKYRSTEKFFDYAASVPLLNFVAGPARVLFGISQVIVGLAGALLFETARCFSSKREIEFKAKAEKCWDYAAHGLANIALGIFETCFTHLPIHLVNCCTDFDNKIDYHSIKDFEKAAEKVWQRQMQQQQRYAPPSPRHISQPYPQQPFSPTSPPVYYYPPAPIVPASDCSESHSQCVYYPTSPFASNMPPPFAPGSSQYVQWNSQNLYPRVSGN